MSRLQGYVEALSFARHVLGLECLEDATCSKRCVGVAQRSTPHELKQAPTFTTKQLNLLHDVLESDSLWDAVLSGFVLFLVNARLRWADGQHVVRWEVDQDDECMQFLEASVGQRKTMRAAQHRFRFLPIAALGQGVRNHDWVSAWLDARRTLGIKPPPEHPPLPAPDKAGYPTKRPVSAAEGTRWIRATSP